MSRHFLVPGLSLISFNVAQLIWPLARTLILARILNSFEFGFASALSASYSTFELVTDIAIHRFVFASPRSEYKGALAAAHGLSVLRGGAAGMLALVAAPGLAYMMSLQAHWMSFAWIGLAIFIRSFEHFDIKIVERDYQYNSQLTSNLVSDGIALAVMIAIWPYTHDHTIYIGMLFAQNLSYVFLSHLFARNPYRFDFGSEFFRRAVHFAYPLVFNGVGLAAVSQGDRLLVGSVLDLETLGIYSVVILTVTVPSAAITRVASSLVLAGLHNASADQERLQSRLILYVRIMLIIGLFYAFGILALMNVVVPLVFGSRFAVTQGMVALLAVGSFINIALAEPTTSVLLINHRTRALAMYSLSAMVGLFAAAVLTLVFRNLSAVLIGKLAGQIFAFGVAMMILQAYLGKLRWRPFIATLWAGASIFTASILTVAFPSPELSFLRMSEIAFFATLSIGILAAGLGSMMGRAYGHAVSS